MVLSSRIFPTTVNTFLKMMNGTSACSFRGKLCFHFFFQFHDFCRQQTHTPYSTSLHEASRETRDQGSNLGAWHHRTSLALLRRPQRRFCCSGYYPARGEAPGHNNYLPNLYATVAFHEMSRAFPMRFYIEIHFTLCGLQATHRPALAGLLLPSSLIVVSLWVVCETAAQHR